MLKLERGDVIIFLSNIPREYDDMKHQIIRLTGESDVHIRRSSNPNISLLRNAVHAAVAVDNNHVVEVTGGNKKNPACISKAKVDANYYSNHLLTFVVLRRTQPCVAEEIAVIAERWLEQNNGFSVRNKIHYSIPTCFEAEINEIIKPIEESLGVGGGHLQTNHHLIQMLTYPGTLFLIEQKGFICSQMVADAILAGEFNIIRKQEGKSVHHPPIQKEELQKLALNDVDYSAITPAELAYQLQNRPTEWQVIRPAVCAANFKSEIDWYIQTREAEQYEYRGLKLFNPPYKRKENKLAAARAVREYQDDDKPHQETHDVCTLATRQGRLGAIYGRYSTLFNKPKVNRLDDSGSTAEQQIPKMCAN